MITTVIGKPASADAVTACVGRHPELVGKQERGGLRKEVRGVAESPNVQASIVRLEAPWYDRIGSA